MNVIFEGRRPPAARCRRFGTAAWVALPMAAVVLSTCAHDPKASSPSAASPSPPSATTAGEGGGGGVGAPRPTDRALTFWQGRTDLIQPPAPPPLTELNLPPLERWRQSNGLDVVAVPRRGLPIISFTVAIKSGGYDEENGRNEGAADFTAAMLRKGTKTRGADQIADAIDKVGGVLDAGAAMESSTISCSVLAKNIPLCLDLLSDLLLRPTFPEAEMAEIRDQMLAAIASRTDDPHLLAADHFDNLLFGDHHPDGWVLTADDVQAIKRQTLVTFWKTFYRPNNAILAVAGDFDVPAMKNAIARALGGWEQAPIPRRPAFQVPPSGDTRVRLVDKPDLTQTTLMFGHPGIRHADPDWYAVTLMNYVLGGSDFSSRLMTEVRAKRGLTYGIGSSFGSPLYEGAFRISASTRSETAVDALTVTVDELRRMKAEGPTASELAKAKGFYAGSLPFELESAAGIARAIVIAELHELGLGYLRQLPVRLGAVDRAAVQQAARTRLQPDRLTVVMVGNASVMAPLLRKAGLPFETVSYRAPIGSPPRRPGAPSTATAPVPP